MRATGARRRRPSPYPRPEPQASRAQRNNRRRYIAGASALAIAGAVTAGLLGTSSAMADERDGAADEVVFNGKCGALGMGEQSEPDKSEVTVTEGKELTFTNNLGTDAKLHLGSEEYEVNDGDSKAVAVGNNTEALMSPDCSGLVDKSDKATVFVEPPEEDPDEGDDSNGGGSDDGNSGGDDSGDKPDSEDSKPGSPNDGANPDAGDDSVADGHAGAPNADKDKNKDKDKNEDSDKPEDSESESSDDDAAAPIEDDTNADGSTTASDVEPVSKPSSSSGLLAVLAAVCLAGVGVAAVRTAMNARRAAA